MVAPSSAWEQRGVRIEADGSIVLERERAGPRRALGREGQQATHVLYHVANPTLTAAFENPGRIKAYQVFGNGPILEPDAWRLSLSVDGEAVPGHPQHTRVRGRLMEETWPVAGGRLTVTSFCDEERNVVYQAYRLESQDGRPHTLEAAVRAGFLADEDQATYALHYDERYGAIVALLGETVLEAGGQPGLGHYVVPVRAALIGADREPAEWRVSDQRAYLTYRLEVPAGREGALCLVVTGGWRRAEHEALFQQTAGRWQEALVEAERYGDWLARRLEVGDPSLHGLFVTSLNSALSAYREDREQGFRGLLPSAEGKMAIPVTLPADAYWCSQALLPFRPHMVRAEILALARAIRDDGRLGLGVTTAPRASESLTPDNGPYDWWPDAADSPSYFAMLVHDYLSWTGEHDILEEQEDGRTVWDKVQACVNYLRGRDTNRDSLFEKRPDQPDWAYDVVRDDWVTYDLALHFQALKNAADIALLRGEEDTARDLTSWAAGARRAINERLWNEGQGYYVDYMRSYQGFIEDHASVDTVVAVLFGLATERQSHRHLEHLERALETHHNDRQYYGDWGVMNCFPFYRQREDLVGRSAWAYSFHNGAAWPGWSGVYALAKMLHRTGDWRYPLERWWTYGLEQYWFTPTEYYAPPYDAPGLRQSDSLHAWGAASAAAMVLGGFGFWPNINGDIVLRVPPWGDSRLNGVHCRGEVYDVLARDGAVTLFQNGDRIASSPHGLHIRLGRVPVRQ